MKTTFRWSFRRKSGTLGAMSLESFNTPRPEENGVLTNWATDIPILNIAAWTVRKIRNGVFKLPLLDQVEGVAHRLI